MRSRRLVTPSREEDLREGVGRPSQVVQRRGGREHAGRRDVGPDEGVDEGALAGIELADDREPNGPRSLGGQVADPRGRREVADGVGVVVEPREQSGHAAGAPETGSTSRDASAAAEAHGARRGWATAAIVSSVVRHRREIRASP